MKRMILSALILAALSACNEEEGTDAAESESAAPTESAGTAPDTEDTATADDGGGAMDGATAQSSETVSVGSVESSEVSQDAIDACIDGLRAMEGATGGTVLRTEFSEANSLVVLEDGSGASWRCLVSNDGSDPFLEAEGGPSGEDASTADDGGGAMDGAPDN